MGTRDDLKKKRTQKQKKIILDTVEKRGAIRLGSYLILYNAEEDGIAICRCEEGGIRKLFQDKPTPKEEMKK